MVFFLALGAAFSNAVISVLQRMGVEDAKEEDTLRLSLLAHALKRKVWLAGFALMIVSFILQALALHFGRLSQVQPILVTEILFLVFILSTRFGYRVGPREWLGVGMASAGLAGFLVFAAPIGGNQLPANLDWIIVGGACVAAMAVTIVLALRGPRWWRASMFGTSAAIGYAFTAAMTKVVSHFFAQDWVSIFWHWQTYALATFGGASVFLTQNAFHAGPIGASQTAIVLVDPLVSIAIGIALFGDNLQTAGARGPLEAFSLLILCVGAYWLSHSTVIAAFKGDGGPGGDLLAPRYQPRTSAPNPPSTPSVPSDPLPPRLSH
jgi:drug/metabolite transporter (DMT)-like permease